MSFLKNLFGKKREPELDLEKRVGAYLLELPRCSRNVVIVSPKYGESYYTCEIAVAAKNLLPWSEHHADAVWSSNQEDQAARKALPLWLRGADLSINSATYIPSFMYKMLRPYALNFVKEGIAKIFCFECQAYIADVKIENLNETRSGNSASWTEMWKCPHGHQLYCQQQSIRVHKSLRDDSKILKDAYMSLVDDFYNTFGFDPAVVAEERPDEVDAVEYYLFFSGLVLACYASFAKETDPEAIQSFAMWTIGGIIREVYKGKSQDTSETLIGKHFERLSSLLEERQDECIDLLVREASRPSGERYADNLTRRASELIFKGQGSGIQLSSLIMKHVSNFSKLFQT